MTEKKQKYESIKNRMTDQPEQSTIGKGERMKKYYFLPTRIFCF